MDRRCITSLIAACLLCGCAERQQAGPAQSAPLVEENQFGPIRITLTIDPPEVEIQRDVLLTLRIDAPDHMEISLPALEDRFTGFSLAGRFERDPESSAGRTTREIHIRLTPIVSESYRVAPIPMTYIDRSVTPPLSGWFPTAHVDLELRSPWTVESGDTIKDTLAPLWIHASFKTIATFVAVAILCMAIAIALWKLMGRVKEQITTRRMSPRERALRELQQLLSTDFVKRGLVKTFYLELTMVVRRYIERQHGVRAPEQTTEEFLAEISRDPRFMESVLARLRDFLRAADMVKFAAYHPSNEAIDTATQTARGYIETDAAKGETDG
jgi:hypothetical protein